MVRSDVFPEDGNDSEVVTAVVFRIVEVSGRVPNQ
jgi:hypothetical protein